jgi:YVTN family beta-propeller protein
MRAAALAGLGMSLATVCVAAVPAPVVVARIATSQGPCGIRAGFGSVWVANDSGTVSRIDPARNRVIANVRVGRSACGIALGDGAVWTVRYAAGELVRVDRRSLRVQRVAVGHVPYDILFAQGSVWVTAHDDGTLVRVDPVRRRVLARISLDRSIAGLANAGGAIWVGSVGSSTRIFRVDPASNRATAVDTGHQAPAWFTTRAGQLWITTHDGPDERGGLMQLDPVTGTPQAFVSLDGNPVQPAFAPDGTIWVPGKAFNTISRVDPATARLVDVIAAGPGAYNVTQAFGDMWVTSYAGTDVWRFRTKP